MRCGKTDLGAELFKARTSALYKSAAIIRRLPLVRAVFGKSDYSPTMSPQHQLQHRPNRLALPIRNYSALICAQRIHLPGAESFPSTSATALSHESVGFFLRIFSTCSTRSCGNDAVAD